MTKKDDGVTIRMPNEMMKGVYANLVSINMNRSEIVLDFAFILPGTKEAHASSRVVMTHDTGKKFLSLLQNGILDLENARSIKKDTNEED